MRPTPEQIAATAPDRSNWVTANAGSGKTHVLTQRVARLLLAGTEPGRILCLTYTKAAANEMQTRLFRLLGAWAMADGETLGRDLAQLAGDDIPVTDPHILAEARRLFARALETPGGLKIQTIHAFCDSLLRRFPLEAAVSPRYAVADDRQSAALMATVRAALADAAANGEDDAFDRAARLLTEDGIDQLADAVLGTRHTLDGADLENRLYAHLGPAARLTPNEVAAAALTRLDPATVRAPIAAMAEAGGKTEKALAGVLGRWLEETTGAPLERIGTLTEQLLTKDGRPRQQGLATKGAVAASPMLEAQIDALRDWAAATNDAMNACRMAARTRDLYAFGTGLLGRYVRAKDTRGLMDFDDLVAKARALLVDRAMRGWVLYKLDAGIDHVLVDEAQDTAPMQWDVIQAISDEFLSGQGAADRARSIFVVGDEKQSIYSFQGADPQAFGTMRLRYQQRLEELGSELGRPALRTSFRSAPAILDFVDAVFEGDAAHGLTSQGEPVAHQAHRQGDRGRVDLWPLIPAPEKPEKGDWWKPVDAEAPSDTRQKLAETVAEEIAAMIGHATLPPRGARPARLVRAGDILVLVAKRNPWAPAIIRALKARDVSVSGADRLTLADELAVMDLLALMRIAILPQDDLSLAAVLRSPLVGLSEEALLALAHGREGTLREALRRSDDPVCQDARAMFDALAARAGYLRPYEFLEEVLTVHDGRRKLIARLGSEAADPIDELLAQALLHESAGPPSFHAFIAWIEAGDITVKREMESGTDAVRVMTVHGAKGLEAPVVILPDTMGADGGGRGPSLVPAVTEGNQPDLTLWLPSKSSNEDDPATRAARDAAEQRRRDEKARLLYVALTRAEDWLILCGAEPGKKPKENWYETLTAGMDRLQERQPAAVGEHPSPTGTGMQRRFQTGTEPEPVAASAPAAVPDPATALPAWLSPAPVEPVRERKSPSGLTGMPEPTGAGLGREQALAKGLAVHALLEHLPNDEARLFSDGPDLLRRMVPDLAEALVDASVAEAAAVLKMPEAARIFGPDALAEAAISVDPPDGGPRMLGRIDRLIVEPDRVTVIDIKSDAVVPAGPDGVPEKYLAQIGAYVSGVRAGWPGHRVDAAILWTTAPVLMPLSIARVDEAFRRANWDARQGNASGSRPR